MHVRTALSTKVIDFSRLAAIALKASADSGCKRAIEGIGMAIYF